MLPLIFARNPPYSPPLLLALAVCTTFYCLYYRGAAPLAYLPSPGQPFLTIKCTRRVVSPVGCSAHTCPPLSVAKYWWLDPPGQATSPSRFGELLKDDERRPG